MPGLIIVTGTDTGIGKTHLATALLLHARSAGVPVVGYKPVESGVDGSSPTDAARLASASSFHVKPPAAVLRAPLSPHLAAEREGVPVPWEDILAWVSRTRHEAALLLELPGGLFTPLSSSLLNVDAIAHLAPDATVLVAPDRLGVIHHVLSAVAAGRARNVALSAIALVTPERADASTGTNAAELRRFTDIDVLGPWPRGTEEQLRGLPDTAALARLWPRP